MDRRLFIKQSCFACLFLEAGMVASSLSSCASLPIVHTKVTDKKIILNKAVFAKNAQSVLLRIANEENDLLLVKKVDGSYKALYMICTHNQTALAYAKNTLFCPLHGSEFDFEGLVTKGPAVKPLRAFPVTVQDDIITIHLT